MIFRPTLKLAAKLGVNLFASMPLADNPYADWSANIFAVGRKQYVLVTNTRSLFSVAFPAKGVNSGEAFQRQFIAALLQYMDASGMLPLYKQEMLPILGNAANFARALNRSVSGSMTEFIHAMRFVAEDVGGFSDECIRHVNSSPARVLEYVYPCEEFAKMTAGHAGHKKTTSTTSTTVAANKAEPSPKKSSAKSATATIYQFKITLRGSRPPIWRRIQVRDCSLDKFHEHIQAAMGWTNSHLHQFEIGKQRYCDPEFFEDDIADFFDIKIVDSTRTKLSQVVSTARKQFKFLYEYDMGDGWEHDIVFESCSPAAAGVKYPRCLEGERNCPPEDVGGIGGFYYFLDAISNPKHKSHAHYRDWGLGYNAEEFNADETTTIMRDGPPEFGD
jgi:hypothetical protein